MKDRLSSLPSNIIGIILMDLPIKDAVRTSILSSRWRYEWSTIPNLIFDKNILPLHLHPKLGSIVDQVLFLHSGSVQKFVLHGYTFVENFAAVDRWILVLSRNGLKELSLKFCPTRLYRLPSSLFSCQALVSLELEDCEFIHPCVSKGFACLKTLILTDVTISDDYFASLISSCLQLTKLVFFDFYGCTRVKINAPNLQELLLSGFFQDIYLENTPLLSSFSVGMEDGEDDEDPEDEEELENGVIDSGEYHNFKKSLSGLLKIERLELQTNMLEFLARGGVLERLPTYHHLKKLHMGMVNFKDVRHNFMICCFFRSSPALQELEIEADSDDSISIIPATSFFHEKESLDFKFNNLKNVQMLEFRAEKPELEFIKHLLENAPMLETFKIGLATDYTEDAKVFKEMMRYRRASSQAEVIYMD